MDRRRAELDLKWREVADVAGLTTEGLRGVRFGKGMKIRTLTKAGIERALEWAPGSVDRILAGGDPEPTKVARLYQAHVQTAAPGRRVITDEDLEGLTLDELEELAGRLLDRIEAKLPPRKRPTVRLSKEAVRSVVDDPHGDVDHS